MAAHTRVVAYLTDVEGRFEKLAQFAAGNPWVRLDASGRLDVHDGAIFVFGGDAIDRGPDGRRIVQTLLSARARQPDRVILLAGNRDINKMRLRRELGGAPPRRAPPDVASSPKPELLKWIFANTMGAKQAFEMRRNELMRTCGAGSDDHVVESYLADLAPGGELASYLSSCQLAFHHRGTLYVHGAVTDESLGFVPGAARIDDLDGWIEALNRWYAAQVACWRDDEQRADGTPAWLPLILYQAPQSGTRLNQASVVYGRYTDDSGNPYLPSRRALERLHAAGVNRVVVGHTPNGDAPSIMRGQGFEVVMADNSYARLESGIRMTIDDDGVNVRAQARLDDGRDVRLGFFLQRHDASTPTGRRDETSGHLVKGPLDGGGWLLFRGHPNYRFEQLAVGDDELATRKLAPVTTRD